MKSASSASGAARLNSSSDRQLSRTSSGRGLGVGGALPCPVRDEHVESVGMDHGGLGAGGHDNEVAVPRGELLERGEQLLALGTALRAPDALLGVAAGEVEPLQLCLRPLAGRRAARLRRLEQRLRPRRPARTRAPGRGRARRAEARPGDSSPRGRAGARRGRAGRPRRARARSAASRRARARARRSTPAPPAPRAAGTARAGSGSESSPAADRARPRRAGSARRAAAPPGLSAARRPRPRSGGARTRSRRRGARPRTGRMCRSRRRPRISSMRIISPSGSSR